MSTRRPELQRRAGYEEIHSNSRNDGHPAGRSHFPRDPHGRALETDPLPTWMGYSIGHWEGDTLVVESNGYNDRTWLLMGYPHSEALRMTERIRRTDFGHLEIAVTFDDPKAYNKPWTFRLSARFAADTEPMEAVCNERPDNGQEHWIGRTTDAQKSAVNVAPEVLAKYAGVY